MKGKKSKLNKIVLSLLLASSMMLSNSFSIVQANDTTSNDQLSELSNEQLSGLTNPVLQSYIADDSHQVWTMNQDTRFAILANQENMANERLTEVVKLINAEFMEKEVVSKDPLAMVYTQEAQAGYNDILITLDKNITSESQSEEAYKIVINDQGVKVTGASENAVLYGLRTIQNLMITNNGLVYGTIIDYPDVAERRVHVDCARKYISKDWFIREIREMSYMKVNALQIHFSENLGFRIECETDPAIVSDQYLTKAEVREIIAEANKYGIKVIPSFDSPGHVDQILKAHPEYGQIDKYGNHFASGLDITNPEAVAYIRSLYSEYMELFEGCTDFHIGGDEYMEFDRPPFTTNYKSVLDDYARETIDPKATWKDAIAAYINDLAEFVHDRGFTPRIFNDGIYYGENSYEGKQMVDMHDYIGIDFWSQMTWNYSIAKLNTFIERGHDTIYNFNASFFYYVLRNDKPTDGREQHSFDNLNADQKIYNEWTPGKFQSNTVADDSSFIKGVAMGIWCDNANLVGEDVITDDIADELRAMASKSWNVESNQILPFSDFQKNYQKLGNVAGYEKGSVLPDPGEFIPAEDLGKVTLHFETANGIEIQRPMVKYGTIGDTYEFTAEAIYGYRLLNDQPVKGTYNKNGDEYVFLYEVYCDKSALEAELQAKLNTEDYITETITAYNAAFDAAKAVLQNEDSLQKEVDDALTAVLEAKQQAIALVNFPLYVEVTYPLTDTGYSSGYAEYLQAVNAGKAVLYDVASTSDEIISALGTVRDAKANLMKPDGNVPTVSATDNYYSDYSVSPRDKYSYDKMLDHDASTKCWFGKEQAAGKEVVFTFPEAVNMSSVRIVQPANVGADALVGADLEISTDKENWTKVGSLTETELDKTISFEKTPVKYVRILLTKTKAGFWYQIQDVYFTFEQVQGDTRLPDLITEAENTDITGKSLASVSAMVDALIQAQKVYASGTHDVEETIEGLRNAIDQLQDQKLDKSELKTAIAKADRLIMEHYTTSTWNTFAQALEDARNVYNDEGAFQSEVDEAIQTLQTAMDELTKRADEWLIDSFKERVALYHGWAENYTEKEFAQMKALLDEADVLLAKDAAELTTKEINALDLRLIDAARRLNETAGPEVLMDNLKLAIKTANHTLNSYEIENVRPGKVAALEDAVKAGLALVEVGSQDRAALKQAVKEIVKAAQELWQIVDKGPLLDLMDAGKTELDEDYTSASVEVLKEALALAERALHDDATEAQVKEAYAALAEAIASLEKNETVDKEALKHQIAIAEQVIANIKNYVPSTVKGLDALLEEAKAVYEDGQSTQEAVDRICEELTRANMKARTLADKSALEQVIAVANAVDESLYTAKSVAMLKAAVSEGMKTMSDPEATEADVKAAAVNISEAMKALEKSAGLTPVPDGNGTNTAPNLEKPGNQGGSASTGDETNAAGMLGMLILGAGVMLIIRNRRQTQA